MLLAEEEKKENKVIAKDCNSVQEDAKPSPDVSLSGDAADPQHKNMGRQGAEQGID